MNSFFHEKSFARKAIFAFALGATLAPSLAFSQSNAASTNKATSAASIASIELTLPEYLKRVEKGSPQILIDRHDVNIAAASYHETRDQYAPTLSAAFNSSVLGLTNNLGSPAVSTNYVGVSPTFNAGPFVTSNFPNPVSTNLSLSLTLGKIIPETGTSLSLGIGGKYNDRSYLTGLAAFYATNQHSWNGYLTASVSQSLLRGGPLGFMGWDTQRISSETARLQRSVYNSKTGGNIINAISAYWTYELNQKLLKLQMDSITDAQDLLAKNRQRVNVGLIDISDVYTAEVNLSSQINQRFSIERDILKSKATLLLSMGVTNQSPQKLTIALKDSLVFQDIDLDEDKLIETALKNRKELEQARIQTGIARMSLRQARSALLPKLDLTLSASLYGFDTNNSDWGSAVGNSFSRLNNLSETNGLSFNVDLQFETPLDPGAYKTVIERRSETYAQAVKKENLLREQTANDIRERIWNLQYLRGVLIRTSDALGLSEQKVAELRRQFNNSKIDTTQFNIGYESLRGTQRLYYATLVQYEVEKAALLQAQGIFLKTYGVNEIKTEGWIW